MKILRIVGWKLHYQKSFVPKYYEWVPMKTSHDGEGYTELVSHPNGAAHFGAWCAMVQVAAKCTPRGALIRNFSGGAPHTPQSLSVKTRLLAEVFSEAIPRLLLIGWLEEVGIETLEIPRENEDATARPRRHNGDGTENPPHVRARHTTPQDTTNTTPPTGTENGNVVAGGGFVSSEMADWLTKHPKVNLTNTLKLNIAMHHWTLPELQGAWKDIVNSPAGIKNKTSVFAGRVRDGEKGAKR